MSYIVPRTDQGVINTDIYHTAQHQHLQIYIMVYCRSSMERMLVENQPQGWRRTVVCWYPPWHLYDRYKPSPLVGLFKTVDTLGKRIVVLFRLLELYHIIVYIQTKHTTSKHTINITVIWCKANVRSAELLLFVYNKITRERGNLGYYSCPIRDIMEACRVAMKKKLIRNSALGIVHW